MAFKKPSVSTALTVRISLSAVIVTVVLGTLWIYSEYDSFNRETKSVTTAYINEQKLILKNVVEEAASYVRFKRSRTDEEVRNTIKARVEEAHSIASHLYAKFGDRVGKAEIGNQIREALRPIRFNNDRGYFFAFDLSGTAQLFTVQSEMEGKSMLKVRGGRGEAVVPDELEIIRRAGEGFYKYFWSRPGMTGKDFEKVAFIKLFKPLGWVIGTGEYLVDMEKDIQAEVLDRIGKISVGKSGYVFTGQWNGLSLTGPAKGRNMFDVTDINGVKIVQELIRTAKNGGGFVEYVIPKFGTKRSAPKVSYVTGIPEWEWYIGAGSFIDEIEKTIAERRRGMQKRVSAYLVQVGAILAALLAILFFTIRQSVRKMNANYGEFSRFFDQAASGTAMIEPERMDFREFENLAHSANRMTEARRSAEAETQSAKVAAEKANLAKSDFLATMSHELRTPLNAISGFSEMLTGEFFGTLGSPKYKEYADDIHASSEHLLNLVNDILDLSAIEAGKQYLAKESLIVDDVIKDCSPMIDAAAKHKGITYAIDLPERIQPIQADRRALKQILLNILSNAVKFTPKGGRITLKATASNGHHVFEISDTGEGVPADKLPSLTDPFARAETNPHKSQEGTGLGLAIVKSLVELHDGELDLNSKLGEGMIVTVTLPSGEA